MHKNIYSQFKQIVQTNFNSLLLIIYYRLVKQLFFPLDYPHQDPIIAVAKDNVDNFLFPIMHDWCQQPPPPVQGLVKPYHVTPRLVIQSNVESILSRLVLYLMEKLNIAKSKYLIVRYFHEFN